MKLRNLLYFLGAVVLALLLTEGVLRVFFPLYYPDDYRVYRYDAAAGYRLKSSLHSYRTTDYQEETLTNKAGTVNFQKDFKDYKSLVFTLGDSFTQGIGVPADASYPFQLDLLLNVKDGRYHADYGVVNLGVAGYGPQQEIVRLKEYVKKIDAPSYILVLVCNNDVHDDQEFRSGAIFKKMLEGNPRYYAFVVHAILWLKFNTEIGKRLTYIAKVRRWRHIAALRKQAIATGNPQNSARKLEPDYRQLVNYSKKIGATLILSWIPTNMSMQEPRDYRWLSDYCRQHNIAFANWFPMVQTMREVVPDLPVQNSNSAGHYRTWVNAMIARAFAKQIRLHPVAVRH